MYIKRFIPEGWTDNISVLNQENVADYMQKNVILQGIVEECDSEYNLHINLGNNIKGIIPRDEVEGINIEENGLPKTNLCTGKVNKYVQFKIKEVKDNNLILLSRKDVQNEALKWVKNDLKSGDLVIRYS